jgi:outer membrane receptor protein involved in Fe transport
MPLLDCALFLVLAAPATQDPGPKPSPSPSPVPPPPRAEYVEVTAKGLREEVDTVPAMVTVLAGEELRARAATDLRDALTSVAGVDVAPGGDGGPASSVPEFWGLKEFDAFLLVADDVPWGGAFNPALTTLSLDDVDHVEVLRGPAPVMYGATSFIGVLHVVHRHPADRAREASATLGSYGSGRGQLGLALPRWGGFDSRLTAGFERRGYRDDRTGFDRFHGLWRNGRTLGSGRFAFDVDVSVVNQDPASPHPREGAALSSRVPLDANHNPEGAFLDDRRFTGTLRYDRPAGSATWSTNASLSHASQDIFRGFLLDLDTGGPNARGIRGKVDLTDFYLDSHVAWSQSPRWKVVTGVDHLHGEGSARGGVFDYRIDLGGLAPPGGLLRPVPGDDQVEDRREFSGLYGFLEYAASPALHFEGGLRLNRTMEEREDPREKATSPAGEQDAGKRTDLRLSGTAAAEWTAWSRGRDAFRVFADYRAAFKPAAFDFGIGEGEAGGEEGLLQPETAQIYEAGLRSRLANGRLELQASGFWMDFRNLVIATAIGGVPALRNSGKNRFKGVEAELEWQAMDHLVVRGAYALHDARFRDSVQVFGGVPTQLAGKRLEMSAHHTAGASLAWAPEHGLRAFADLHYVGSRFLNKRNTALADGYAELSGGLGWRAGRVEVRVDGHNLTDQRPPVAESELGDAQYYRLPARRMDVTARLTF